MIERYTIVSATKLDIGTCCIDVDGQATLDELVVAGVSTFSAKAVSYINSVEEYNVTTGGAQFGPRISGFQLSSMWDVGNYKSLFSVYSSSW